MYHHLLLHFVQRFSHLQQYLIILLLSAIFFLIFNLWWCIVLLPISTVIANLTTKRLLDPGQTPLKFSGHIYNFLIRKHDNTEKLFHTSIEKEVEIYKKTIIARYICVWYYPLISTNQDFPNQLKANFDDIFNQLNIRLTSLNIYDVIRRLINLKQKHMEQYLYTIDSFRKQRKQNRISKNVIEEFSHLIGFHSSIVKNDIHAYLKAFVELLLTDLTSSIVDVYSDSRPVREFLTEILVNCIFVPILNEFSKPRMIYYLLVVIFETDEQKQMFERNENSLITSSEINNHENEKESEISNEDFSNPIDQNQQKPLPRLERIIYSATIIAHDKAYNPMSGSAYTVYIIQCETKSPYTSNATHRYTIRRRFREFMHLHKRLQQNHLTSRYCYDLDDIFRVLPIAMDNMNPDIIRRRRCILEQYIQKLISNEVLNCSHDVLEFFAYNSDPNIEFEALPRSKLPVPRVDKVLLRTLTDVGTKLNNLLPTKREITPLRETFQLNISTIYEDSSYSMQQLKHLSISSRVSPATPPSKPIDMEFLQSLLTRPSITSSHRKERNLSNIPLTDAVLKFVYTCLHSRDTFISNESVHQLIRVILGHLIEEFLKNEIDDILSSENIITYLVDLRTKVLWPEDNTPPIKMKNIKHRAYSAIKNKIPMWLQYIVGLDNIHRIIVNLLECLSYEELNRHFLCNAFDLLIEQLIPDLSTEAFLTRYVHIHNTSRT